MRLRITDVLALLGAAIVSAAVLVSAALIAKTPENALDSGLPAAVEAKPEGSEVAYTLASGRSARDVGNDLQELGVVRSGDQFALLVKLMGLQTKMSAGDYILRQNIAAATAIELVAVQSPVPVLRVTFPEGIRIEEMAVLAERAGFGRREEFLAAAARAQLPAAFAASHPAGADLQGYLFPDTYILPVGSTPEQLVAKMLQTLERRFTPELIAAAAAKGLTPHQALTLASIVEREAVLEAERPLIAGVFLNRLEAGDMLGADPTVQFTVAMDQKSVAEFGYWKKELTLDDLALDSPYNTRKHAGLPPGPITNPGLASIEAVAKAPPTKMYYFVANAKKGDGSHVFAETFAEHERNIATLGTP